MFIKQFSFILRPHSYHTTNNKWNINFYFIWLTLHHNKNISHLHIFYLSQWLTNKVVWTPDQLLPYLANVPSFVFVFYGFPKVLNKKMLVTKDKSSDKLRNRIKMSTCCRWELGTPDNVVYLLSNLIFLSLP